METIAKLISIDALEVRMKVDFWAEHTSKFGFYENEKFIGYLTPLNIARQGNDLVFSLHVKHEFVPGNLYQISDAKNTYTSIDLSYLASTEKFIKKYRYDGQLGTIYAKDRTTFRVFSPLASLLFVFLQKKNGISEYHLMKRLESGVYEVTIEGDLDGTKYFYSGLVNGKTVVFIDPYSLSTNANSRWSYVIDSSKILEIDDCSSFLPPFEKNTNAIIYELDVRDMTSLTKLEDKGKYSALSKDGLYNETHTMPIGLSYIADLGVTHVQLLPVYDFQTINDLDSDKTYNWGYDPYLWLTPEGSYSSDPNDPYARIIELKQLVAAFHKKGIRVNMDVVFNHVFDRETNPLEISCPGYFFRKYNDGTYSNGSYCGNDFNSSVYMGKKIIIDTLKYYVQYFGIDGFRFDLMGLLDLNTMNEAYEQIKVIKHNVMFYGEGWNMNTALSFEFRTVIDNAFKTPSIGFFSDTFRDSSKGETNEHRLCETGYLLGNCSKMNDFKFAFAGSCLSIGRTPLYVSPNQSIDYVECHDNHTLWDKLKAACPTDSDNELLAKLRMINGLTILSFGVPFIHMGQEIGLSKKMNGNSFFAGDIINGMDYDLAYKRIDNYRYTQSVIKFKKEHPELAFASKNDLAEAISFMPLNNGGMIIKIKTSVGIYYIVINNNREQVVHTFSNYVKIVLTETGGLPKHSDFYSQTIVVQGFSFIVCFANKDDGNQ